MSPLSDVCVPKLQLHVLFFHSPLVSFDEWKCLTSMNSNLSMFPSWLVFCVVCNTPLVTSWSWRFYPRSFVVFLFMFWSTIHLEMISVSSVRRRPGMKAVFSCCLAVGVLLWDLCCNPGDRVAQFLYFPSAPLVYLLSLCGYHTAFPPVCVSPNAFRSCWLRLSTGIIFIKNWKMGIHFSSFISWKTCIRRKLPICSDN